MHKRVTFQNQWLPYLLVAPQIIITLIFFIWPAIQALTLSLYRVGNVFTGGNLRFVGLQNFERLLFSEIQAPIYFEVVWNTLVFSTAVTFLSMGVALILAVKADQVIRGATTYKTLLIWPYAVAPAVAGVLWLFLFAPEFGVISFWLGRLGYEFDHVNNAGQAMFLVIVGAAWKQISYNFIFFLAGLQAIPKPMLEAAAIDGASPMRRFWTIVFPLLSPTTFFLLVVSIVYAFFDTFGVIHAVTEGGPVRATQTMVYKIFDDGLSGSPDLGSSSAQSVILMAIVMALTVIQFRYVERRVHYA